MIGNGNSGEIYFSDFYFFPKDGENYLVVKTVSFPNAFSCF